MSGPVALGWYFEKLIDRGASLSFEEVRSTVLEARFERNRDEVPNLGYSSSALWLRFRPPAGASRGEELLLEIRFPSLDRIEFYAPQPDEQHGVRYRRIVVGDTLPWRVREVQDRNYVFRIQSSGQQEFYLRVTNEGPVTVPAYLWRPEPFAAHSRASQLGFGVFYGLLLALILYNLMLYVSVRDRAYLYYVLYGTTFGMWLLAFDGFVFEYLGPEGGWWPNNGLVMFISLSMVFGAHFARAFLDTPRLAPWSDRLLQVVAGLASALAVCAATGLLAYRSTARLNSALAVALAILIITVAVRAVRAGNRIARFFLLAWTTLLAGMVVFPLRNLGWVPYNLVTAYSLHIGFAFDLLLLSFALGDRINIMRREAEMAKSEARAMDIASRHKSEFLTNMSHELRTPLNAILGFSEMLRERYFGDLTAKQAEYVNDIREAGSHLLSLINDILDLSKIEAGRMDLEIASFHLPTAISNAITLVRERALRHGITLGVEVDPRLGDFQADERKVKQILLNLLSNAVKFTPEGGRVDVSAKLDTGSVEIAVRDTGAGIAPADQASLFEEFKQVGKDAARKAEGTGLGLALTKRFVELHGGTIQVKSAPSMGSTFSFTLPIRNGE